MTLSEEAVTALELMPVGILDHERNEGDEDTPKLETIKYTTNTLRKLSYASSYCAGHGGLEEAVPHAITTEKAIMELVAINNVERAMAFKKSLAGPALDNANVALAAT